jgi:sortase A
MALDTRRDAPPAQPPAPPRSRGRRVVRGIGKTLITLGVLVLLFVAFELWGTGVLTQREQGRMRDAIGTQGFPERAVPGGALGFIRIPKIDLDMVFVEGSEYEPLKKGPGHYSDTPLPGKPGTVGIAGHRTTYLHPFWALDRVKRGDIIELQTRAGEFRYRVTWQRVVTPYSYWVLNRTKVPSLTLTTCHPRFSARQRLVVRAVQISGPGTPRGVGAA